VIQHRLYSPYEANQPVLAIETPLVFAAEEADGSSFPSRISELTDGVPVSSLMGSPVVAVL